MGTGDFEGQVRRKMERLMNTAHPRLEVEVAQKRRAWFAGQKNDLHLLHPLSPRMAYELLFFTYLGLKASELPVILETDDKIVWHSQNACPTLDACQRLGRDTREVCRAVYERATQAFLSQLDPQLRFLRSYQEIRPYFPYCKEWIVRVDFRQMMTLAHREARATEGKGEGAIIVFGQDVVGKGQPLTENRETHTEQAISKAIRQAVATRNDSNLCGTVLFSTYAPDPASLDLAKQANITTIVYDTSSTTQNLEHYSTIDILGTTLFRGIFTIKQ